MEWAIHPSSSTYSFLVIANRLNICQYWPCYYYYCNYKAILLLNLWLLLLVRIIYTSRITRKVSIEDHEKDLQKSIKYSNTMRVDWMDRGKAVPLRVELATCSLDTRVICSEKKQRNWPPSPRLKVASLPRTFIIGVSFSRNSQSQDQHQGRANQSFTYFLVLALQYFWIKVW